MKKVIEGKEQLAKGVLFLIAIIFSGDMLSAVLFNADHKIDSSKMKQEAEMMKRRPLQVSSELTLNKMKKVFGQVPNTSYYELGRLQIQKAMMHMCILRLLNSLAFSNG